MKVKGYEIYVQFKNIEQKGNIESHNQPVKDKKKRICCFCGKGYPEVKFSDDAHAVSEAIGNKCLFSHYECDNCNHVFGEIFEDSFGKYMMPFKILTRTFGKSNKNIIKDKGNDELNYSNYRFQGNKNGSALKETEVKEYLIEKSGNGMVDLEKDEITIPRQKYIPEYVYCALLKMAYSIIPVEDFQQYICNFISLRQYAEKDKDKCILSDEEKELYIKGLPCKGILEKKGGVNPLNGVNVYLLKKVNSLEPGFDLLFLLEMKNYSFLIPVMPDNGMGDFSVNVVSDKADEIEIIDFRKVDQNIKSTLSKDRIEIPREYFPELEEVLRANGLLKKKE